MRFEAVEASDEPADEKLRGLVKILLRTWRNDPALVTVMVREVGRSPHLATQVDDIGSGFAVIERVVEQGQADGVFRPEIDAAARELGDLRGARGDPHRVGAWDGYPTATRRSPVPSARSSTSSAAGSRGRLSPPDERRHAVERARARVGRARPRLGADDDRGVPAADPRAVHRLDDARRARARCRGGVRAHAAARDRARGATRSTRRSAGAGRSCSSRSGRWPSRSPWSRSCRASGRPRSCSSASSSRTTSTSRRIAACTPTSCPDSVFGRAQGVQHVFRGVALAAALIGGGFLFHLWRPAPFLVAAFVVSVACAVPVVLVTEDGGHGRVFEGVRTYVAQSWRVLRSRPGRRDVSASRTPPGRGPSPGLGRSSFSTSPSASASRS